MRISQISSFSCRDLINRLAVGTSVAVFGSQGSIDVDGQPVTTYSIDGVVQSTYKAPVIQPGFFTSRTQFFQSSQLTAGDHTLVIETTNGTRPNRYWLDWIQYVPAAAPAPPPQQPTTTTTQPPTTAPNNPTTPANSPTTAAPTTQQATTQSPNSSPPTTVSTTSSHSSSSSSGGSPSVITSLAGTSGGTPVYVTLTPTTGSSATGAPDTASPQDASGSTSSSSHTNVGAIAGGVIGGVILIAIIIALFFFCRRRQRVSRLEAPEPLPPNSGGGGHPGKLSTYFVLYSSLKIISLII